MNSAATISWISLTTCFSLLFTFTEGYVIARTEDVEIALHEDCRNFTYEISEHLRSPGYPDNYLKNLDCRKVIKAGPQFNVNLKFMIFHLEASQECRYDYIEIRDGMYGFSPLLFKGCGDDIRHGTKFTSTGQYMWIRFVSDAQISRKGFLATITATPKSEFATDYDNFECYTLIEDATSFRINSSVLPEGFHDYYQRHPDKAVDCVWDIRMPADSKVFARITNYTVGHLTAGCDSNYLEFYDISTALEDVRQQHCRTPHSPWTSGASRGLLHLYSHSIKTLPDFTVIGNIYRDASLGNCSGEEMFSCYDGYCIPAYLMCDFQENCREGYDEDCLLDQTESSFDSKYITLFAVVIVGSVVLTTLMTLVEVFQRRKAAQKEREKKKNASMSSAATLKSSSHSSISQSRQRSIHSPYMDQNSSAAADSTNGTFTSSRFNENVSFRKPQTPVSVHLTNNKFDGSDRIYAMPHITLPPSSSMSKLPPAPPTPPPPPIPADEGRGFRLIYDLTNLGKAAGFEYPPPPSFVKQGDSTDDYSSTSSSSFGSLPNETDYDMACLGRKNRKSELKVHVAVEPRHSSELSPPPSRNRTISAKSQTPATTTKRSWTFDDDTDDGAMELTTYISTC